MRIGFLLFDNLTQLDFTGPFEVFASIPEARICLIADAARPIRSDRGLMLASSHAYEDVTALDLLIVPGGPGIDALLNDAAALAFVRRIAASATYVASVCTGALLLAAAGLLRGRRATTHWNARDFLRAFSVEVVAERVVVDLPFITGGGVTAGIDFALSLVAEIFGRSVAEGIQLRLEYSPRPPFRAGSPEEADPQVVAEYLEATHSARTARETAVRAAIRRLEDGSADFKARRFGP